MFSKLYIALAVILVLCAMCLPNGKNLSKGWLGEGVKYVGNNLKTAFQNFFDTNRNHH